MQVSFQKLSPRVLLLQNRGSISAIQYKRRIGYFEVFSVPRIVQNKIKFTQGRLRRISALARTKHNQDPGNESGPR